MIWLPLAAQALATGVGLAGSAALNKRISGLMAQRQSDINSLFNRDYAQGFTDTEIGASMLRKIRDSYDMQVNQGDQSWASTGATSEAKIAARDKASQTYNDAVNRLAGYGTSYRDSLMRDYQARMDNLFQQQIGLQSGKAQSYANIIANAGQLGGGLAGLFDDDK